ncbi:flagellar hook-length control protein FliK [Palleronia aestuarii]|uniref:Flagellar hook-length control protein FliK n=1 Tax=Palleronia aestuarii TaxID=568105 RepID=A0A2W7N4S6_9RHOB|nr:flagellar hook-length control protein FliK [Palleronia aestuarii]PZX15058.1 flagellar hook-length control protein FliK [Palleronia aestuarii]
MQPVEILSRPLGPSRQVPQDGPRTPADPGGFARALDRLDARAGRDETHEEAPAEATDVAEIEADEAEATAPAENISETDLETEEAVSLEFAAELEAYEDVEREISAANTSDETVDQGEATDKESADDAANPTAAIDEGESEEAAEIAGHERSEEADALEIEAVGTGVANDADDMAIQAIMANGSDTLETDEGDATAAVAEEIAMRRDREAIGSATPISESEGAELVPGDPDELRLDFRGAESRPSERSGDPIPGQAEGVRATSGRAPAEQTLAAAFARPAMPQNPEKPVREEIVFRAIAAREEGKGADDPARIQPAAPDMPKGAVAQTFPGGASFMPMPSAFTAFGPAEKIESGAGRSFGEQIAAAASVVPGPAPSATATTVLTQAFAPPPPSRQIAEAARSLKEGSLEITLSPRELGTVRMTLSPTETGHAIVLQVERDETLNLLRRHAAELQEAFRQMDLGTLDISFGGRDGRGASSETSQDPGFAPTSDLPEADRRPDARPMNLVKDRLDLRL